MAGTGASQTLYDFGNPTAEEQLYIELINRARANPPAEGARLAAATDPDILAAYGYFKVDLSMMQSEFNSIAAAPPLAPNSSLTSAARSHSLWMLNNATQSHDETNPPNTIASRIKAAGFDYQSCAENIYAYAKSVGHGHAGFEVDWGTGANGSTGGMQNPRGHRDNIHNPNLREIGVGVVSGTNGAVGPQLVTQDFGTRKSSPTFATGVAYYDLNSNNFYDIGEGISGLTVNVSGATYYCTTASGGGWTVPVPDSNASRTVTFGGLAMNQSVGVSIQKSKNAKVDLKLAYIPPAITSASTATAGSPHTLAFTTVGGATGYKCDLSTSAPAAPENCENATNITKATTGTYSVVSTGVKQQGSASFHLLNPTGASQWIELNTPYFGGASPSLSFQSRVAAATTDERFKVQVREEGGVNWQTVYDQAGTNSWGENSFTLRSASLAGMTGKTFRVRFLFDFQWGSYYGGTDSDFGWYIDAISFSGVSVKQFIASQTVTGASWSFTPAAGSYQVSVTPIISGREFPASYQSLVVSGNSAPATYSAWAAALESAHGLAAGTLADANGDYDRDGRSNLLEYAFGGSPVLVNDPTGRLPVTQATATHLILRYQVDTSLTDLAVTPQACPTMGNWKTPGESGAPGGFSDQLISTSGGIQTREARVPLTSGGSCFLRLRVTRQ